MRAADFLAAAASLPFGDLDDLTGGRGLVVVAPHPDDESLGCGGLLAEAARRGVLVRVVVVSDGAGSHPGSRAYPAERLRDLREAETRAALAALGVPARAVAFLRLPDRSVPTGGPAADAAVSAIAAAACEIAAGAVLVTSPHDPHRDHAAAYRLASRAVAGLGDVRLYAYPVWAWTLPPDAELADRPVGIRFATDAHRGAKARAIAAHRSQTTDLIDDDPSGFRLPAEMVARFVAEPEMFWLQAALAEDRR